MRFPSDSQHLSVVGATGSGKTQAALFHLSNRQVNQMPWVVYNFKNDASIDAIPFKRDIGLDEIPIKPGIYIAHPKPDDVEEVEKHMWEIWTRTGIGVYVDEGYMVGNRNPAFRTLLTQGRSLHTPVIVNSQRPAWVDPFVFTEASYYQVFRLNHRKDVKRVEEFIPHDLTKRLPDYHSYYYDVGDNKLTVLKPVPSMAEIHRTFYHKLAPIKKTI